MNGDTAKADKPETSFCLNTMKGLYVQNEKWDYLVKVSDDKWAALELAEKEGENSYSENQVLLV
jgi:hypothetical protein